MPLKDQPYTLVEVPVLGASIRAVYIGGLMMVSMHDGPHLELFILEMGHRYQLLSHAELIGSVYNKLLHL